MTEKILVDTSGFFAFLNEADAHHVEAKKWLLDSPAVTTNYIFDELMTLLGARGNKDLGVAFGEELRRGTNVTYHFVTAKEEEKAWEFFKKYRDHPLSFTDCTSVVVAKEHRIAQILSFDQALRQIAGSVLRDGRVPSRP